MYGSTEGYLGIVSSFGSSALIGYPVIQYAFANNTGALAEGIVISELGVGLPIFIFCPLRGQQSKYLRLCRRILIKYH